MEIENLLKIGITWLSAGIQACAAFIIGFACILAMSSLLLKKQRSDTEFIRLSLGRRLALALEFELASDILRTTVTPSWNDIGQLAAIITLRTLLNYFLQREIEASKKLQEQTSK